MFDDENNQASATVPSKRHHDGDQSKETIIIAEANDDAEPWKEEAGELIEKQSAVEIHGWTELREQIKRDLKKHQKILTLTQTYQLILL